MHQSLQAMRSALRVLAALTEKREPSPGDVQELESFIGPKPEDVPLDEWAREAIIQAVERHRAASRGMEYSGQ
jgi:hypothetical protein